MELVIDVTGRAVVVTGGSSGIGLATAHAFIARGDSVVITGRRADRLAEAVAELGPAARGVAFDAADPAAVAAVLDQLPAEIDVLVNNAGGNTDLQTEGPEPGDLTALAEAWRANLDANLISAVLVTAALEPRLADHARVITIGSIAAKTGAGSYGAAKAALEAWNVSLASEVGPRGITANVVSPGLVIDTGFFHGRLSEERRALLIAATSTKRPGEPEDVAAVVRHLASADARHVTGQVIHVNGGAYLGR